MAWKYKLAFSKNEEGKSPFMLAARFYGPKDIRIEEVPLPDLPRGGALLKVKACGLCGTDKRIYNFGHFHITPGQPRILGHEVAAEIVALDSSVKGFAIGDRVTLAPNVGCGVCKVCRDGYTQLCPDYDAFGISLDGGFAEYMAVPPVAFAQGNVIRIPTDFTWDEGALMEITTCAYRGLMACHPKPDDSVLIIGGGVVTYLMTSLAKAIGVHQVIVSVISNSWKELSARAQPDQIINSREVSLKDHIWDLTEGRGADVIIVACSAKDMDELAPELAAVHGRINFFGGLTADQAKVTIDSRAIHYREVTVTGITGANVSSFLETRDLLAKRSFDLAGVITHHYPLAKLVQSLEEADASPRLKTIITCAE
jgi:L-iditol 2-dehydrogenase